MEDGSRVPAGDDPSYWLDACEDISCDDFIDFDVSSIVSDQPDNPSNQDFFGGIDKILDSIKNGAGLPLNHAVEPPNNNGTAAGEVCLPSNATLEDGAPAADAFDHSGGVARSNGSSKLSNGNETGVLVNYSQERGAPPLNGGHDFDGEERCSKRAWLGGYNNERPYYCRGNYQGKERERCFNNNNRKRPRGDRDEIDRKDKDGGGRKREHYGAVARRDVRDRDCRDRETRGYWERDKSGSTDMIFRTGAWEPDHNRDDKMVIDTKLENYGKLDKKSEDAIERVPEEKARQYQLDVLEQSKRKNTIAFLETGAGKTLIAVLLIKSIQDSLQKQNKKMLAVFLVPKVPLVYQQAEVIRERTGYQVGHYCGEMGQDFWDARRWQREFDTKHVLVMTAQILLNILRHSIIKMEAINLLILDECHHAVKKHPYSLVMSEFYHTTPKENKPSVFGMTASPVNLKDKADGC